MGKRSAKRRRRSGTPGADRAGRGTQTLTAPLAPIFKQTRERTWDELRGEAIVANTVLAPCPVLAVGIRGQQIVVDRAEPSDAFDYFPTCRSCGLLKTVAADVGCPNAIPVPHALKLLLMKNYPRAALHAAI